MKAPPYADDKTSPHKLFWGSERSDNGFGVKTYHKCSLFSNSSFTAKWSRGQQKYENSGGDNEVAKNRDASVSTGGLCVLRGEIRSRSRRASILAQSKLSTRNHSLQRGPLPSVAFDFPLMPARWLAKATTSRSTPKERQRTESFWSAVIHYRFGLTRAHAVRGDIEVVKGPAEPRAPCVAL
jgi:hypothetical protein